MKTFIRSHLRPLALALVILAVVAACNSPVANSITSDQSATNTQMNQYQKVQPLPYFDSSALRASMIGILKAQTTPTNTWSVEVAYTGVPIFMCPSIGYPIPATDELTNPQQVVNVNTNSSTWISGVVSQADPNGVYGGNTNGTYIMCVGPDGKVTPVYSEPDVNVFPFPVAIVDGKIVVDPNGKSTVSVDMKNIGNQIAAPSPSGN